MYAPASDSAFEMHPGRHYGMLSLLSDVDPAAKAHMSVEVCGDVWRTME